MLAFEVPKPDISSIQTMLFGRRRVRVRSSRNPRTLVVVSNSLSLKDRGSYLWWTTGSHALRKKRRPFGLQNSRPMRRHRSDCYFKQIN